MTAEWTVTSRSSEAREALRRLARAEHEVAAADAEDLAGLVASLHSARGIAGREHAARVLAAMLRSQQVHPLVARAILQAIMPGLVSVARRLQWGAGGEWEDGGAFFADLVATAWEVILAWSGADRNYAVLDLLSAIRCRARRQLLSHRSRQERFAGLAAGIETVESASSTGSDLDDLARAIDIMTGRGMDQRDAAVLYSNKVLGFSLGELSEATGLSRRRLDSCRRRAARAVCA